jgi:type II secretory pathway component GspD/PulD (secretin)
MNNRPATITSGINFYVKSAGNLGVTTGGALGGGTNLQTISSGVTMSVTPQITADNKIYLVINVTSSQPNFAQSVDGIPTVSNNNATTSVLLSDGETTIIAGMFQLQDSMSDVGMPFLRSIPIIGRLFGSSSNTRKKKELVVFIKPSIVAQALKELGKTDLTDEEEAVIQRTLKGGEKLRFERL